MRRLSIITLLAAACFIASAADTHSPEAITHRLDAIYKHVLSSYGGHDDLNYGMPTEDFDSIYCSTDYNATMDRIFDLADEDEVVVEADHWIQGQDWQQPMSCRVLKVYDINGDAAKADVVVHNFSDHQLTLVLVYERGNWYIDDFISRYDDYDYDDQWRQIPGTYGPKEDSERHWMRQWLSRSQPAR